MNRRVGPLHDWQTKLIVWQLDPRAYGTIPGQALFRNSICDAFVQARAESGSSLRVFLVIEDPELKELHWERLCASIRLGNQWDHLTLDQQTLFSLYLPSLTDRRFPVIGRRDLRALVLAANTPDDNPYGLDPFDQETLEALRYE